MGSIKFFSSSSNDCCNNKKTISYERFTPSPEVHNYTIERWLNVGRSLVVKIRYNDAKNYEGLKIMVYKDCDIEKLKAQKLIDPHFAANKTLYSPFARFEPTADGWNAAIRTAEVAHKQ